MRTLTRHTVALALAFVLAIPSFGVAEAPVRALNIMPLHNQAGQNFCTAWHINSKNDLWATAGHCVAGAYRRGYTMMIAGRVATLVYINYGEENDIAVLQVRGVKATPFQLASRAPESCKVVMGERVCAEIFVIGYPYGLPVLTTTPGIIAARRVPMGMQPTSDILTAAVAGGNSGSPVLDKQGRVVGLLWGAFTESPHSLAIPYEAVKRDIGVYFGR